MPLVLEERPACPHICDCLCHRSGLMRGLTHCDGSCCDECPRCGKNISVSKYEEHRFRCHPEAGLLD